MHWKKFSTVLISLVLTGCQNHVISISEENDAFTLYGPPTDANYTQGLQITATTEYQSCSQSSCQKLDPRRLVDGLNLFRLDRRNPSRDGRRTLISYGLAQEFWTPNDISVEEIIPDDRPYGGFLNGVLEIHNLYLPGNSVTDRTDDRMQSITLRAGIIGPYSFAEDVQKKWHEVCSCQEPRGWDNQLHTEPGFIYTTRQDHRHFPIAWKNSTLPIFDVVSFGEVSIGNVYTGIDFGGALRFGYNLPRTFVPDAQMPVTQFYAMENNFTNAGNLLLDGEFYLYGFVGVEGRVVLRDIFLDGNTLTDSPHRVDKEYFVGDGLFGAVLGWRNFELSFLYAHRSPQYRSQDLSHRFGQIKVTLPPFRF